MSGSQNFLSRDEFLFWWDTLSDVQQCAALHRLRQEAALRRGRTQRVFTLHPLLDVVPRIKPEFPLN